MDRIVKGCLEWQSPDIFVTQINDYDDYIVYLITDSIMGALGIIELRKTRQNTTEIVCLAPPHPHYPTDEEVYQLLQEAESKWINHELDGELVPPADPPIGGIPYDLWFYIRLTGLLSQTTNPLDVLSVLERDKYNTDDETLKRIVSMFKQNLFKVRMEMYQLLKEGMENVFNELIKCVEVLLMDGEELLEEEAVDPHLSNPDEAQNDVDVDDGTNGYPQEDEEINQEKSAKIRVPKRPKDRKRWFDTWNAIKVKWRNGYEDYDSLLAYLGLYHPDLVCSLDVLADIIRAGEAGALD